MAIAAFAGLSYAEIRGLQWEDHNGETLKIRRNLWMNVIGKPKTPKRRESVPVIAQLKKYLDMWKREKGWILADEVGGPLNLEWMTKKVIKPALKEAGIEWRGWYGFRRGLATNLYQLGVSDKVIQAILRHSNVQITQASYIKEVRSDVVAAMQELERTLEKKERVN